MSSHYVHIWWGMMLISNPIQDLDPSDTCNKKYLNPMKRFELSSGHQLRMDRWTDGQTDARGESSISPLNFVARGIKTHQWIVIMNASVSLIYQCQYSSFDNWDGILKFFITMQCKLWYQLHRTETPPDKNSFIWPENVVVEYVA